MAEETPTQCLTRRKNAPEKSEQPQTEQEIENSRGDTRCSNAVVDTVSGGTPPKRSLKYSVL